MLRFSALFVFLYLCYREDVAVKVISRPEFNRAAQYEHYVHSRLRHVGIVKPRNIITVGCEQLMLVQEYVKGCELFDKVEKDFGVQEHEARRYTRQLVTSYHHGQVRPCNLVICMYAHLGGDHQLYAR